LENKKRDQNKKTFFTSMVFSTPINLKCAKSHEHVENPRHGGAGEKDGKMEDDECSSFIILNFSTPMQARPTYYRQN